LISSILFINVGIVDLIHEGLKIKLDKELVLNS
jgi:hypothetical protein